MIRVLILTLGYCAGCAPREEVVATRLFTLFGDRVPVSAAEDDFRAGELGVKLESAVAGEVLAVRFYRTVENPRGYLARLWSEGGTLLASQRVPSDAGQPPGWRVAPLDAPVPITPGVLFVASYYADAGRYQDDQYAIASPIVNGPLTAPAESAVGANGVYLYAVGGGFPTEPWRASNYWVDVTFRPAP